MTDVAEGRRARSRMDSLESSATSPDSSSSSSSSGISSGSESSLASPTPRSPNSPDYLAQLLKDRKQMQAFSNVFIHLGRILEDGESLTYAVVGLLRIYMDQG